MEKKLICSEENNPTNKEDRIIKIVDKYGSWDKDIFTSANFISRIFLYWAYKIIKLGNLISLKPEYFGTLKGKYSSVEYLKNLKKIWDTKGYKFKGTLPLIQAGFRSNISYVIIVVIFSLIKTLLNLLSIDLFREYMKRFGMTNEQLEKDNSYYKFISHRQLGIICLVIKLFEIFFDKRCNEYQLFMAYKSNSEFQCLLFDKLLKVSPSSKKERAETGELINYMQIDAHRLTLLMMNSPELLTIPTNIIGYNYMLFKFFGFSFIFAVIIFIIIMILNFFFSKKFKKIIKKQMILKDKRMKKVTETFNNIKTLKLYAWENEFKNKIDLYRENELENLEEKFHLQNLCNIVHWFAPVAISTVTIGAYQYFNPFLKIEDIMTSLRIFNSLQKPIKMIPIFINNFNEVEISMKRMQKYLFQDEINPANVIYKDKYMDLSNLSVKIENGNYSWGIPPTSLNEIKKQDLKLNGINLNKKTKEKNIDKNKTNKNSIKPYIELNIKINKKIHYNQFSEEISTDDSTLSTSSNSSGKDEDINEKENNIYSNNDITKKISDKQEEDKKEIKNTKINILEPLLKNINLEIKKGEFICVIGEVGSGKSSLLQAILNNMLSLTRGSRIYINGSISYVSQIPWIRNATIKDNILFYQSYDEEKYNKVIELSQLRQDLEIFEAGDLTEIGEKGVNLSGGQKARISIARALYSNKDIYLFDDPISALDANVGMNIMNQCIIEHLSGKTRILVTHALQYISLSDRIIYMNNGEIKWIGTYNEIKEQEFFKVFFEKIKKEEKDKEIQEKKEKEKNEEIIEFNSDKDLKIIKEKVNNKKGLNKGKIKKFMKDGIKNQGKIKLSVYRDFLIKIGGSLTLTIMIILIIIMHFSRSAQDLWLGYWTEHQEKSKNMFYFSIFSSFGIFGCLLTLCKLKYQTRININVSRGVHKEMIQSLIRAPIPTFHEIIPQGQILDRFSSDINSIDRGASNYFLDILYSFVSFIVGICICGYYEPYSLLVTPIILYIGQKISTFYRKSSRELQRIENNNRSPILNICSEAIPGISTIRAFGYQQKYMSLFHEKVDEHLKLRIINSGCVQWYNMNLDLLSYSFVAFLIICTILFKDNFSTSAVAIIYTYCDRMKTSLINGLRTLTFFENSMIGYERCIDYTKCPSEASTKNEEDSKLNNWPNKGKIEFINFSVKYRPDTEMILKKLNFTIQGKEKIGIVGRTGSGKSTITLCLFRILEATEGKILIDDVDISTLGLEILRNNLTIIPQDPALMEGSLRYNIDPLNQKTDNDIIKVMQKIGFDYIIKRDKDGLYQEISESGSNLSVGEKQLICITRAILRKSKIIIMDEATASIDYITEEIIQKAIDELLVDSTFITIAHRIKTILNYDKILTLDNGIIVDYDLPNKLINNHNSLFYELYSKSNV